MQRESTAATSHSRRVSAEWDGEWWTISDEGGEFARATEADQALRYVADLMHGPSTVGWLHGKTEVLRGEDTKSFRDLQGAFVYPPQEVKDAVATLKDGPMTLTVEAGSMAPGCDCGGVGVCPACLREDLDRYREAATVFAHYYDAVCDELKGTEYAYLAARGSLNERYLAARSLVQGVEQDHA